MDLTTLALGLTILDMDPIMAETSPLLKEEEAIIAQALWVDHIQIRR